MPVLPVKLANNDLTPSDPYEALRAVGAVFISLVSGATLKLYVVIL